MSKANKVDTHKKDMLKALEASMGIVSTACKQALISRTTHYEWMQTDPEYKAAVEEIQESTIDIGESALMKRIENGDTTAIIFYLKTKGKKRGYVERHEVTGAEGGPLSVIEIKPVG